MIALADNRSATPHLQASHVLLSGSGRIGRSVFDVVTRNLISLGALALEELATSPKAEIEGFDIPYTSSYPETSSGSSSQLQTAEGSGSTGDVKLKFANPTLPSDEKDKSIATSSSMQYVAQLHKACQQAFGNHESLKFEFIEEGGPDCKQCILTIKRPNGLSRSYTSESNFKRKSDAKARAAAIAVEMGAIDFILTGNKEGTKSQLLLAPIDGKSKTDDVTVAEGQDDETSQEIQACCIEWRAGQVHPRWVFFAEHKGSPYHGCVLVIDLSAHLQRVYSVSPIYKTMFEAKRHCSLLAVKQGVIDFIKFGNGQTAPAQASDEMLDQATAKGEIPTSNKKGRAEAVPLQSFFDTLPKPFPEPVGDRPISEFNAPGMLNNTLQLAKGAKLSIQFYFLSDSGMQGCILRLDRPEETRTYMVDPKFAKRPDAKAAVCLLAMSQGVCVYIREIAAAIENKITVEMRKKANEQILPILGSEYAKLRQGMHPSYEYDHDQGAFGCSLLLTIPSRSGEGEGETRKWSVTAEYRTKQDAKIAVVCKAGAEAIEFVRFKGQPPPPGHDPFKPYKRPKEGSQAPDIGKKADGKGDVKREDGSPPFNSPTPSADRLASKRQTSTSGQVKLGVSLSDATEEDTRHKDGLQKPKRNSQVRQQQGTYASVPPIPYGVFANPYGSVHPYDVSAAASAVIDRLTGTSTPVHVHPSQPSTSQSQPPPTPIPTSHMHASPPHPPPPSQPYAVSYYPEVSFPPDARPFPTMSHYPPPPPNVYQLPAPPQLPPAYGGMANPHPPPHAAYYPDPRIQYYISPSPYHTPPSHLGTPYVYPQPPPMHSPYPDPSELAHGSPQPQHPPDMYEPPRHARGNTPPYRSTSFSNPKDRQKRPRSRDRTPTDTQVMKKQRSESSLSTERNSRSRESPSASDRKESPGPPRAKSRTNRSANSSAIPALFDYCADEHMPRPEYSHKIVSENGRDMFKVWVVLGKEKLELPTVFHSVNEGKQRLAKQVLQRLKSQSKTGD